MPTFRESIRPICVISVAAAIVMFVIAPLLHQLVIFAKCLVSIGSKLDLLVVNLNLPAFAGLFEKGLGK